MLAATALTCWYAHRETGNVLFLHTQIEVNALRPPPVESVESAEWDDAMRDAGDSVDQMQPVFMPIVGLLDVTLPVIWLGGAWLGIVAIRELRRK